MHAITFPAAISAETVHKKVLDTAWQLLDSRELNLASFVEMIALNAPNNGGAALFNAAISRSLIHEAMRLAGTLMEQGLQQYPDDEQLRRYQKALAPPKVLETGKRAGYDFSKSMQWLSIHNQDYIGQWVH